MINKNTSDFWKAIAIILVVVSHYFQCLTGDEHILSTVGPLGVDIFFLLSGFGLTCSALKNSVNLKFILNRIQSVYIPYLLVAGGINLIYDDLSQTTPSYWFNYFTGYDYWFMNVLFVLYLSFMVIYGFFKKDILRLILLTASVILYSIRLYQLGRSDFWTLSNAAFLLGAYAATLQKYKPECLKNKRLIIVLFTLSCAGSFYFGIASQRTGVFDTKLTYTYELYCNLFFSSSILFLLYLLPVWDYVLCFLGKYTLYIYLTHSVIFWKTYPHMPKSIHTALRVTISFATTCLLSVTLGFLYNTLSGRVRKGPQKYT